jgi:hypothetical protein
MATFEIREGVTVKPAVAARLAKEAVAPNRMIGDPTKVVKPKAKKGGVRKRAARRVG